MSTQQAMDNVTEQLTQDKSYLDVKKIELERLDREISNKEIELAQLKSDKHKVIELAQLKSDQNKELQRLDREKSNKAIELERLKSDQVIAASAAVDAKTALNKHEDDLQKLSEEVQETQ
ncbi:hypothetical protein COB55_02305 [Candidatus Wolfebacteria bacterium]|nr:MAG: hypothetical protein COB55_02305 [Candidatus Wolfebacteria bacterium]